MQFVESMLEIHMKYLELIQTVFNGDKQFAGALDKVSSCTVLILSSSSHLHSLLLTTDIVLNLCAKVFATNWILTHW